jgi:hypothetical protein
MGAALALDRPRQLNGVAKQQQLFRDGGFTRVRVGNDREGSSALDLVGDGTGQHILTTSSVHGGNGPPYKPLGENRA